MSALLTPMEAAERLRVSRSTLYLLIERGDLVGLHVGRRKRLFTTAEIDDYIEGLSAAEQGRRGPAFR